MKGRTRAVVVAVLALAGAIAAAPPDRGDPRSRIGSADGASEYWDLVSRFESGHRVLARFLITNEGPGDGTAVATGYLVHPDGAVTPFKNGRRSGLWQLDADGRRIAIGSSVLDFSRPTPRFVVDNDKRGIKIHIDFEIRGAVSAPEPQPPGYTVDLLDAAAPARARLWVQGMEEPVQSEGRLGITHTRLAASEADLCLRRIDFFSLGKEDALYVREITTPGGERSRWLVAQRGDQILLDTSDFGLRRSVHPGGGSEGKYPVPQGLVLEGSPLQGQIVLGPVLVQDDPFEVVPQPFRFLLSFASRPHRVWLDSPYDAELATPTDQGSLQLRGLGVTAVTFTNPVPASLAADTTPGAHSCKSPC